VLRRSGLALALVAFPGLVVEYDRGWIGLLFVPAIVLALGGFAAARRGVPILAAGRWLTERPLRGARPGIASLPAPPLVRRLVVETGIWILAVGAWVLLARSSGLLVFGTGLASVAYGAVQALASRARVRAVESERGVRYAVAERPGLGLPRLSVGP
jgi:hypothetical protein